MKNRGYKNNGIKVMHCFTSRVSNVYNSVEVSRIKLKLMQHIFGLLLHRYLFDYWTLIKETVVMAISLVSAEQISIELRCFLP